MEKNRPLTELTPPLIGNNNKGKNLSPVTIYTDGASRGNPGQAGIGAVIHLDHDHIYETKKYIGIATNNTAEYRALIHALAWLQERGWSRPLMIYSDSQLMVRQLTGRYKIKQAHLQALAREVHKLLHFFPSHEIIYISREENRQADRLANEAISAHNKKNR